MHIDPWILTFSLITVVVTIAMGFWSAKKSKTASDFFVAGRSVSVGWNASAISGEYLSAASFMGIAGMVMSSGYDALWYPVCYACGYLFLLLFIAGPLRRFGAYTIPDFAEGRYDSPLFRKIAVIFVLFIGFFYTMPQMKGAGTTLAYVFPGLPYWVGVAVVGAVITLNVALGGMKGITLVQAFQYWAKMFAISVPIFVLMSVYGHYGKQLEGNNGKSSSSAQPTAMELQEFEKTFEPVRDVKSETNTFTIKQPAVTEFFLKLAQSSGEGMTTIDAPNAQANTILRDYEFASHAKVFRSRNLSNPTIGLKMDHVPDSKRPLLLEDSLKKHGIALIRKGNVVLAVPESEREKYEDIQVPQLTFENSLRKPLPDKAPADQKWISPFGPLTTKAIGKSAAANAHVDLSKRDLLANPNPVAETPAWTRNLEQLANGKLPEGAPRGPVKYGTGDEGKPLAELAIVIQHWAHLSSVLCESNLLTKNFVWNSTNYQSPTELMASLEKGLNSDGVSVLRASDNEWWLVSTANVKSFLKPLDTKPYALLYTYSLIIALVCGTAGLPHILVRFYTNPDGVAAKRTTMWVMILIGIFYVFPPVFGVMGRNFLPELYSGTGAKGTDKIVLELPRILNSGLPAHSPTGSLEAGVGEKASKPVSQSKIPWGSILSGITCAGAFAAFMSTFSGLLVSMTGALAHDVYGRILRPKSTPEQRMRMFKFGAVIIGAIAILLGMQVEQLEINFMVGQAFAIAAASYFPLLFMSVWWRGMTQRGAATGMLTGGLLALGCITLTSISDLALKSAQTSGKPNPLQGLENFWIHHPAIRIMCEQPAIWAVPLAIILMIIVSKLTRKEVPSDIRMKMLVLHAPEKLGLKQEYIEEHQGMGH